jgi:hypothetical protein
MRKTLTLDEDVAALLIRVQAARSAPLKAVVNEALRLGLSRMAALAPPQPRCETRSFDAGRCLVGSLDDVAEALAVAEGESFR